MRILIADDHSLIRKGLKHILMEEYPSALVEETEDAEGIMKKMVTGKWDLVISDLSMPGRSGLDVVQFMKQNFPLIPVLLLSMFPEDQYAIRALKTGAAGYLSKDTAPEELIKAVRTVMMGRKYISPATADKLASGLLDAPGDRAPHEFLTHREFEVFQLLSSGHSVSDIAEKISLSITTVSTHRSKVLAKMSMKSNADLTRYALENKLI